MEPKNANSLDFYSVSNPVVLLSRSFGLREEYAEMIQLCRNCRCLFWRSLGHPCIADQDPAFQEKLADVDQTTLHVPIPPQTFLKFFSL